MPRIPSPALVSKRMTCNRCLGIKFPSQRFCDDCVVDIDARKESPELTTAGNWNLRSAASKRASYVSKRKKQLAAMLSRIDSEIKFVQWQKQWQLADTEIINKAIYRLSNKREKLLQKYISIEKEMQPIKNAQHVNEKPEDRQPKGKTEATIESLRALLTGLQKG